MVVRLRDKSVREWGARTVFPIMRTGILSCLGLGGGTCSTERTGHPNEVYLRGLLSERILKKCALLHVPNNPDGSDLIRGVSVKRMVEYHGNSQVGVTSRVIFTIASNPSLIVALLSLKSSAPAMAADV